MSLNILLLALISSYLLSMAFTKIKIPSIFSPLTIGFLLSFLELGRDSLAILKAFSEIGLLFLMFYIGLKIDFASIRKNWLKSVLMSFFCILIPFLIFIPLSAKLKISIFTASVIAIILSVSDEALSLNILENMGIKKPSFVSKLLSTGVISDSIGIVAITIISTIALTSSSPGDTLIFFYLNVLIFLTFIYVLKFLILPLTIKYTKKSSDALFGFSLILIFIVSAASEYLNIEPIIGAFFAGLLMNSEFNGEIEKEETEIFNKNYKGVTFQLFAPFFFIYTGLSFSSLDLSSLKLGIVFSVIAILSTVIATSLPHLNRIKEGIFYGLGLNARGFSGLVVLEIARESSLMPSLLQQSLLIAILITTLFGPLVFEIYARATLKEQKPL